MKLFVTIYNDARLLGHFLRHYRQIGITQFYIATAPEFFSLIDMFRDRYNITAYDNLVVDDSILAHNSAISKMRRLHQDIDEWVVIVDLDEFIEYGQNLYLMAEKADCAGANVVRGLKPDRFSADGSLPDVWPDSDLETLCPIKSRFIKEVMHGCDYKGVLVKGDISPVPGQGHHRFIDEKIFPELMEISHFKWIAGAVDRLRKTHQRILEANIHWAMEHRVVLDHYDAHGFFAWREFGGKQAADFKMPAPIACVDCGAAISEAERDYSCAHYGKQLCRLDQKKYLV